MNVCFEVAHVTGNVNYIRKSVFPSPKRGRGVLPPYICYLLFVWGVGGGGATDPPASPASPPI